MVWQAPQELERNRQAQWRVVVLWALFGLLVVAAVGVGTAVRASSRVSLGGEVRAGALVARVPEGWQAQIEPGYARIIAQGELEGSPVLLEITLEEDDPRNPRISSMVAASAGSQIEPPRRVSLGERSGTLLTVGKRVEGRPVVSTAVAMQLDPATVAIVEIQRPYRWNPVDSALVQQVAATLRVQGP